MIQRYFLNSVILFLSFCSYTIAQSDKLESESVEIIKNFEAQLAESEKLDINPSLPLVDSTNRVVNYQIKAQPMLVNYPAPDIKPIAMKSDELPTSYQTFIKGGAGIPNMYYGEVSHFGNILDRVDFGAGATYHRANNNKNVENQKFINTDAFLQGAYRIKEDIYLQSKVNFSEQIDHFFGYDNELFSFTEDQVRQRFRSLDISTSYISPENDIDKLNYGGTVDFYSHKDLFDSRENGIAFTAKAKKFLKREHPIGIEVIGDLSSFKDSTDFKQTLNNLTFRPTASFHAEKFRVMIGGNLIFHDDSFSALPMIEAIANIAGNKLVALAGWEGNVEKNTFRSLTRYNPYLVSTPTIFNTKYNDYYAGLKGNIKTVNYVVRGGYKTVDRLPLYTQSLTQPLRFDVLDDEANIWYIEATAEMNVLENLAVGTVLSKSFFNLENQVKPWGVPTFEVNVNATYTLLDDKLNLTAEFYATDPVANITEQNTIEFLNTLYDLSISAQYNINDRFGAWVDLNNITANRYERWKGYRTFGTNFMAGIFLRF
jgi:hypothetical protein